jgi:hypothetical protein
MSLIVVAVAVRPGWPIARQTRQPATVPAPTTKEAMKAVVHEDTRRVGVQDVEEAAVEEPTDVVVRVTASAICGTDLHMLDGRTVASERADRTNETGQRHRATARRPPARNERTVAERSSDACRRGSRMRSSAGVAVSARHGWTAAAAHGQPDDRQSGCLANWAESRLTALPRSRARRNVYVDRCRGVYLVGPDAAW